MRTHRTTIERPRCTWRHFETAVEIFKLLVRGADPHALNVQGNTPFQLASNCGHTEIAQLLLGRTGEEM
jgi:ankyrin repeat protein